MLQEEVCSLFLEHVNEHAHSVLVSIDGSKSAVGIGYGVFSDILPWQEHYPGELQTLLQLYIISVQKNCIYRAKIFTVFSNSKTVLQFLSFSTVHLLALEILQQMY